jgi:hypothetical protein
MPVRSVNVSDEMYSDIHREMGETKKSYSFVVNRRLIKLAEIEGVKKE